MRIVNQSIPGVAKVYNQQNKEKGVSTTQGSAQKDQINISQGARFVQLAHVALRQLPQSNQQKLQELQLSIKTGTYEVNNEELAEKIWQESFLDQRI